MIAVIKMQQMCTYIQASTYVPLLLLHVAHRHIVTFVVFASRQMLPHFVISLDLTLDIRHWSDIKLTFLKKNDAQTGFGDIIFVYI